MPYELRILFSVPALFLAIICTIWSCSPPPTVIVNHGDNPINVYVDGQTFRLAPNDSLVLPKSAIKDLAH